MSSSAAQLGSITTRDTVDARRGTLEFGAGLPAADAALRRHLCWITPRSTCRTSTLRECDGAFVACVVHKIVTPDPSASERL
jgi:hypothetical protein